MTNAITGNTFQSIDLGLDAWPQDKYPDFVKALRAAVTTVKEQRRLFYDELQRRYRWVNRLRSWMVWCTVGAGIATALSAIARLFESQATKWLGQPPDVWLIVVAFVLYALIAGMALYERAAEGTGHYFRAVANILQIRDAWTDYQFKEAALSLEPDPDAAGLVAMKTRWLTMAQTFVVALDKQATTELNEWHTAFSASLKEISDNATASLKANQQLIDSAVTKQLEQAKQDVAAANRAAEEAKAAAKLGSAEVTIADATAAEATLLLDGAIVRNGRGRSFVIPNIPQGRHVIRVEMASVDGKPGKSAETAKDFTAAILSITLTPA